ncbi:MAG: ligase-associated DNA damage response endonuclease PdeM, partial [Bacteroidota bacterium]
MSPYTINHYGETLHLLADRAIYWPAKDWLLIADAHLGKAKHFRKGGLPVPRQVADQNFKNLDQLLAQTGAGEVLFLGDLFHSDRNSVWDRFGTWMDGKPSVHFRLIKGNHDILHESDYTRINLPVIEGALEAGPFLLTHEPLDEVPEGFYNLCGHIHPSVRLKGPARQYLRLPCFYFGAEIGILPAFGAFTGMAVLNCLKGDQVFVI